MIACLTMMACLPMTLEQSVRGGYAAEPGSGPRRKQCGSCGHFLSLCSPFDNKTLLGVGHCLRWLELMGEEEGAAMAREGDPRALFAAHATVPAIPRRSKACCEYEQRQKAEAA